MAESPEKIRTFVAIYPPTEIIAKLQTVQTQLQKNVVVGAVRWTKPEQIHLKLQFLGYVERDLLGKFASALERVTRDVRAFSVRAESIGCFPNNKHPKIIWAGLAGELKPLDALKEKLDVAFGELGYMPEKRKFHAHLTLGRFADLKPAAVRRLAQETSQFQTKQFGEWEAREICFMQSVLSSAGASHSVLNLFALKKV